MNPRTVWRRTSTQTHGRGTATLGSYARTTHWYAAAINPCGVFVQWVILDPSTVYIHFQLLEFSLDSISPYDARCVKESLHPCHCRPLSDLCPAPSKDPTTLIIQEVIV